MEALTVDQAREAELSLNPIKRVRQASELAEGFMLRRMPGSISPLPLVMGRHDLVRLAEAHERVQGMVGYLATIEARSS